MGLNILVSIDIFYPQINGIVTTTMNLLKNFKQLGHNPVIVTPRVVKGMSPVIEDIPVHYIPSTDARTYPGLRLVNTKSKIFQHIVEQHNTDIIQTTSPWVLAKALHRVGKAKDIPMINTFHTNLHNPGYIQYLIPLVPKQSMGIFQKIVWHSTRQFLDPTDVIVGVSPHTCQDVKSNYPKKRVEWIPNGVYIDMFKKFGHYDYLVNFIPHLIKEQKQYAIFVGRQAAEKSIDVLLESTAIVQKSVPDFQLVIVGDGPKLEEYKQMTIRLGIENNISFLGRIAHEPLIASGLIQNAKFFTSASITETHSMTVTEALCCGTPVVVADDPSMTYLTETTGYFFKADDPIDMARALKEMWLNDAVYNPRKDAAQHMLEQFDGRKIAEKYIALYEELLEGKNKKKHKHSR